MQRFKGGINDFIDRQVEQSNYSLPAMILGATAKAFNEVFVPGDATDVVLLAVGPFGKLGKVGKAAEGLDDVFDVSRGAYEIAKDGGKHAGFLNNYIGRPAQEIEKGIRSLEVRIAEHRDKIANPERYIPNFRQLDIRQQESLIKAKWPSDIRRQAEQLDVLRGLKNGK